jgi:hypothetical protein
MEEKNKESMKKVILRLINESTGIKQTELVLELDKRSLLKGKNEDNNMISIFEEIEKEKEVCVLQYVVPQMSYRQKTIYFPKGTKADFFE